ncbi:bifunctional folylpolyglutamate synthase/dihydrofolate synthase [Martelella mediterranea]|uniref:tetrahydrofolate synthase n=1 Tax=Martelella mediterranea TaxID=293089 RepID=A0A4R3NX38_9HYPH|nr:folylpolyglutamate synthase/dihydrofolate synthase family protein [Martelella mediterranea]TCT44657.1 dihydrofolate synthase/folylpolyglutamate synthase [Martelella mediterranea]
MDNQSFGAAEQVIEHLMQLHPKGFDLSLDRIRILLEKFGNPHKSLPPVIHIAGTNGKGSTSAFCRALLEASGLSVHVHSSPHLVRWHERFRIGGPGGTSGYVDDTLLAETLRRVEAVNDGAKATVFELLTAATFVLFADIPADVVILEVGLGGRYDATNVIDNPAVSVIMPISLDHQAYLGDRVELIAAEKAGIMKPGSPVVIGHQEFEAAEEVLIATADRLGCPLHIYGQDFTAHEEHGRLVYQDGDGLMDLPLPLLPGRHQHANAAAAIAAVKAAGFVLEDMAVERAMQSVFWPARLQRLYEGVLVDAAPQGSELWLDGGHNPGAGEVIAEALASFEEKEPRPLYLIIGMINTKDPFGFFEHFAGLAHYVYCAPIKGTDAFIDPVALASSAADAGLAAEPVSSIGEALEAIYDRADPNQPPPRILIGGSLYFAGNALAENGTPPA